MRRTLLPLLGLSLVATVLPVTPAAAATSWASTLPVTGDVTVPAGTTAVLDTDVDLRVLRVDGTVTCAPGAELVLHAEAIHVRPGGVLRCGTPTARHDGTLTIVLDGPTDADHLGMGARSLAVAGRLELHGPDRGSSRRSLARTAPAGATSIELDDATGLRPGDELVVTSTDYVAEHDERVTVTSVTGDTVGITPALDVSHHCASETHAGRTMRACASVGILTRDIAISGPGDTAEHGIGGHVMAMGDGVLALDGVALRDLGQRGVLARYPVHWHGVGDGTGSYVRDSAIVDAHNRFLTIHGTDGVEVVGTVGAGTVGHGFYLEDGAESGNRFVGNLGTGVREPEPADALTPSDLEPAVYWISNPDNELVDNVAVGGHNGFSLSFPDAALGHSAHATDLPRTTPLGTFRGNTASGAHFAGLFVDGGERPDRTTRTTWYAPRVDPADPASEPVVPVFEDFTAFKVRQYGIWIRTHSGAEVVAPRIADTWRGIYLANVQTDGHDTWGTVRGGLVVGESDNVGTAASWAPVDAEGRPAPRHWDPGATISGVQVYDGPLAITDTVLADFVPRAGRPAAALGSQSPNDASLDTRSRVSKLTLSNAQPVRFGAVGPDGDDVTLVHDDDGSLTGTAGATVTSTGALLDDADCRPVTQWAASVCTGGGWAGLYVLRRDGVDADADLRRTRDGRTARFEGDGTVKPTVRLGERHDLTFLADAARSGKLQVMVADRSGPGTVDLTVPHGGGVPDVTFWSGERRTPMASSAAALRDVAQGWFLDTAARRLHLRIAGTGVTVHATDPVTTTPAPAPPPVSEPQPAPATATSTSPTSTSPTTSPTPTTTTAPAPAPAPARPASPSVPANPFDDVAASNVHVTDIARLAASGVTRGCGPDRYCPDAPVTRAQMASFLVRALGARAGSTPVFADVPTSNVHRADIGTLAALRITRGCGPDRFCPDEVVTRAQMASFLVRALDLPRARGGGFDDVSSSNVHADDIAALAAARITRGCGPDRFCPDAPVTRAQMASFLVRAFDL